MLSGLLGWGSSKPLKKDTNTESSTIPSPSIAQPGKSPLPSSTPTLESSSSSSSTPATTTTVTASQPPGMFKLNTNFKLLLGGLAFLSLSLAFTRRSLNRKRLASIPPYYTGSIYHRPDVNGAIEAFEALNIATLNVFAGAMVATGGVLYALDVNSMEDLRRYVRGGWSGSAGEKSKTDAELEEELEEWIVMVLGRKADKQIKSQLESQAKNKDLAEGRETDEKKSG